MLVFKAKILLPDTWEARRGRPRWNRGLGDRDTCPRRRCSSRTVDHESVVVAQSNLVAEKRFPHRRQRSSPKDWTASARLKTATRLLVRMDCLGILKLSRSFKSPDAEHRERSDLQPRPMVLSHLGYLEEINRHKRPRGQDCCWVSINLAT